MTCNNCSECSCSATPATEPKFFRSSFLVEVLSQDEPTSQMGLSEIAYAISEGDCSGATRCIGVDQLTAQQCAAALLSQGSSPSFFKIEEHGEAVTDPIPRHGPAMLYVALTKVLEASHKGHLKGLYGPLLYYIDDALKKNEQLIEGGVAPAINTTETV